MPRSFAGFVQRRILDIDAEYERRLAIGFPLVIDGDPVLFEGEPETLQVATVEHQVRWSVILGICDEVKALGGGDQPLGSPLRCSSNRSYPVTYGQAADTLRALRTWAINAQINWTRLKDLARAAVRRTDLDLIDLSQGWS